MNRSAPDRLVPARVFIAIGAGIAVLTVVYGVSASEQAGKALLTMTAGFCLWIGAYLWLRSRPDVDHDDHDGDSYLPHASAWPFGIGVGAFMLANGLLIGGWFFVPGVVVTVLSLAGFVRQTRARS